MLQGTGLVYATTLVQLVGRLALTFVIGRSLGTEGVGVFSLGLVTVQALTLVATNGQDLGLLKFVAPAYQHGDRATTRAMLDASLLTSLGLAFVLMVVMFAVFPLLVLSGTASESARAAAPWFAPAVFLQTASGMLGAYALACGRIQVRAYAERVFGTLTQLIVTGVLLWLGWELWGVVIGALAAACVTLLATVALMYDLIPRHFNVTGRRRAARQLFGHSWKLGLANGANYVFSNWALFVLGSLSAAQAGLYAAASRLTLPGSLFMDAFATNFAPHAAGKMNDPSLARDYQRVTMWMIVLSAPVFILLFAFARQWMNLLGSDFAAGAVVLMVLAVARFLDMFTGNAGVLISLSNRPELRVLNTVLIWGTNLVLIFVLMPQYGVLGAAIAYLCAILVTDVLEYLEVKRFVHVSPWNRSLLKPVFLILCFALSLTLIQVQWNPSLWQTLALSSLFLLVYAATMWFVGLPQWERTMLHQVLKRLARAQ